MIAKRKRAQRSRLGEAGFELNHVSRCGGAGGTMHRKQGYKRSAMPAMRIFCV
jgi:hypothetical protein